MLSQYIYQPVNYYILIAIRCPVIYRINLNKILTVYNFHSSDKDLVIEYMYPNYNSILVHIKTMYKTYLITMQLSKIYTQ